MSIDARDRRPHHTPAPRALVLAEGVHGPVLSVTAHAPVGPITLVGFAHADDGGLKLLIAEGEAIPRDASIAGIARTHLRFALPPAILHARWNDEGPTLHLTIAAGHVADEVRAAARRLDITVVTVAEALSVRADAARRVAAFGAARASEPRFGGQALTPLSDERRATLLTALLPILRTAVAGAELPVMQVDTSPIVRELVCSRDGALIAQRGTACAAYVARTGHVPLWIDLDPWHDDVDEIVERVARGVAHHRADTGVDADLLGPRVVLIAGVGQVTIGATTEEAQRARDLSLRAIAAIARAVPR